MTTRVRPEGTSRFSLGLASWGATLPLRVARRDDDTGPALDPGCALEFISRASCATVVTRFTQSMAETGLRRVVPSDLYPLVLRFLRDNQLSEVASKFAKATGAVSPWFGLRSGVGRL